MEHLEPFRSLDIDWTMTPEEAVTLYLEWGNNWRRGERPPVRSKNDVSYYFVVNTWDEEPKIYLIRRNSEEARELIRLNLPDSLKKHLKETVGHKKGVWAITPEIKKWLHSQMYN